MADEMVNPVQPQVIIAGFGVPGRFLAEMLEMHNIPYCVVERNHTTVNRLREIGTNIVAGDIRNEALLESIGVKNAWMIALTFPDDAAVLEAVPIIRRLNPSIRIVARCAYTSCGLMAEQFGANDIIVHEQVVARELVRLMDQFINRE
jgi:CPA2 family monovalent cation:H+ antiporter-2